MIRTLILAIIWSTLSLTLIAEDPKQAELKKKPMYERTLMFFQKLNASNLKAKIKEFENKDDYESAINAAKDLLALRKRIQGDDHYEVKSLEQEIVALQKISDLTASERSTWRQMSSRWIEAKRIREASKYEEALVIEQEILDNNLKILGANHPEVAVSYNEIASLLNTQRKSDLAQQFNQKALDINRLALGEYHPKTAMSLSNLAFTHDLRGNMTAAQPLHEKALEIRRRVLGENHLDTANSYNNLAWNLTYQGKVTEAQQHYEKALDIRRRLLGESHTLTATSYSNVAFILQTKGNATEAYLLHQKSLDITRRLLGEKHPDTATSYNNVAFSLQSLGKTAEAHPLFEKALEIRRISFGEGNPETAVCYNNVAANLITQGKVAEAQHLLEKALDIFLKIEGESHPNTLLCFNNVALNLHAFGKLTAAQQILKKVLDIRRRVLGESHPDTAFSYYNLASNLTEQRNLTEAQPLFVKALGIHRRLLGENHPTTAQIYGGLAKNLLTQDKLVESLSLHQKALNIHLRVLGESHRLTVNSYEGLASNLIALKERKKAHMILTRAVRAFEGMRVKLASGIDRGNIQTNNPRVLTAAIEATDRPISAWINIEAALARGLLDQQVYETFLTQTEKEKLQDARNRLASTEPRILKLVTRLNRSNTDEHELEQLLKQRSTLEDTITSSSTLESERAVASSEQIQTALPADAVLLLWVDVSGNGGVEEHFACVVRSTSEPKWVRLPGMGADGKWTKDDLHLPSQLRDELSKEFPSQSTIESLAKKLHAQRIVPVLKHLDGVKTLYVVGVHEMAGIPVELMTDQFTISYVPSGTYLARLKDQPKPMGTQFLALGDAIYETEKAKVKTSTELPPGGILITQVIPMSAADKAGLQVGDVILKYGEIEITKLEDLQKATAGTKAEKVSLTIWREGRPKPFTTDIAAGRMGVVLDLEPAPVAIANRRKTEAMLASIRGGEWGDLPGTRVETNRLKQLFGDNAKVFTDGNASEQTLESLRKSGDLSKYRYLHFATHGEGNNVKAFESSLILSQDNLPKELMPKAGEPFLNGQLSAREVLDHWKLNAELVTLSACETAIGKSGGGDGLLGFAQAFLTAGARSVCLSLWQVDDIATALLMSRFYENLLGKREGLSKPMGKAAALDEAKRWLRNLSQEEVDKIYAQYSKDVERRSRGIGIELKKGKIQPMQPKEKPFAHPMFWAAFILIGDPD